MPLGYFTDSTPLTPLRDPFNVLVDGINAVESDLGERQIQTYRWANAAARTAQTGMIAGDMGYQIDTDVLYRYSGSTWSPYAGIGGWQTATLAANWSAPANYLAPAYRIVNGWCELRGTGRYSATIPTSNTNFLTGLPAPASTDNDSVWLMGPSNASTVIFLNPRTDGIMRARSAATGGAGTDYVHLDGLRYWVG